MRLAREMTDSLMIPLVALQVAVHALREREDGQTKTQHALVLGLLVITIIVALFFMRSHTHALTSDSASSVSNAPGP